MRLNQLASLTALAGILSTVPGGALAEDSGEGVIQPVPKDLQELNSGVIFTAIAEDHGYEEFGKNGETLQTTDGSLYGGKVGISNRFDHKVVYGSLEARGGTLDYDGETLGGSPLETDERRLAYRAIGGLGFGFAISGMPNLVLSPAIEVGYQQLRRSIDSPTTVTIDYGHFRYSGILRADYLVSPGFSMYAEGGYGRIAYASGSANYPGDPEFSDMGGGPWYRGKIGIKYRLDPAVEDGKHGTGVWVGLEGQREFYEYQRSKPDAGFVEPKSETERNSLFLKLGFSLRPH